MSLVEVCPVTRAFWPASEFYAGREARATRNPLHRGGDFRKKFFSVVIFIAQARLI